MAAFISAQNELLEKKQLVQAPITVSKWFLKTMVEVADF